MVPRFLAPAALVVTVASGCGVNGDEELGGPPLLPATAETVLAEVRRPGARATLVNVWATWCAPCREEFPELLRLRRAYADSGLRLLLVSADFDDRLEEARRFLARQGVDFPSWVKTGDDLRFIDGLSPRWGGALPATFLYDGSGKLRLFREGRTRYAELEQSVRAALRPPDSPPTEASP